MYGEVAVGGLIRGAGLPDDEVLILDSYERQRLTAERERLLAAAAAGAAAAGGKPAGGGADADTQIAMGT